MKKILFFAVAVLGLSISSIANNIDDLGTKTRVNVSNGVETVITQKTFTAETLASRVKDTNRVLEIAFGKKAKVCTSKTECTYDYYTSNGDTARLLVNRVNNTLILITKKVK